MPKTTNLFTERIPYRDTPTGADHLRKLAEERGLSEAALLRALVREEWTRRLAAARRRGAAIADTEE